MNTQCQKRGSFQSSVIIELNKEDVMEGQFYPRLREQLDQYPVGFPVSESGVLSA
jgi:hypothetical protein